MFLAAKEEDEDRRRISKMMMGDPSRVALERREGGAFWQWGMAWKRHQPDGFLAVKELAVTGPFILTSSCSSLNRILVSMDCKYVTSCSLAMASSGEQMSPWAREVPMLICRFWVQGTVDGNTGEVR